MDQQPPLPAPTPLTEPYWAACRRGVLALQRCAGCTRLIHFPQPACPFCGGANLGFHEVSGDGTVHTFSVVHRSFLPGFAPPYVIGWIDLPEGARAFGNILGPPLGPPEDVTIGAAVRVCFQDLPGFGPVPQWRLT